MALNPIEILKDTIASVAHTVTIDSVVSLGGGQYQLNTSNTYYLNNRTTVTIDSVDYKIVDFSINSYITVEEATGQDVPVTASTFDINSPLFIWGAPQLVSGELVKRVKNKDATWPYMWIVRIDTNANTLDPAAAVKTTASYNILLLDSADKDNWDIETHYDENIYPLNNYITFFLQILKSRRDIFATDLITYNTTNHVNFGDYIVDKGNESKILNDNATGIQIQLDAPLIIQTCNDPFEVLPNCPIITETFNGASISSPTTTKAIVVQSDAVGSPQVGTIITDTPTALTVEVPDPGAGCQNIAYVRNNLTTRGPTLFTNDTEYLRVNVPSLWTPITGSGELPVLDQDTPTLLTTKNTFDNFNRVTNDIGTQTVADVGGGVTSDGATANYMIDHLTGMGWYMLEAVGDNTSWDDSATAILAGSFAGFSDWRMPTTLDIREIETLDNINAHIFVSFSSWNDTRYWTSDSGGGTNVMRWTPSLAFNSSGKISLGAKTAQNPIAGIACRQHFTSVQPKP